MLRRPTILAAALAAAVFAACVAADESGKRWRVYEQGPLTANDFQAPVPEDDQGLDAFTLSDLRYEFQYDVQATPRRATAWVSEITLHAIVDWDQSWNKHPSNERLMDHEQGHFDLTYIAVLRARLHFAQQRVSSVAPRSERAVALLRDQLQQQVQRFVDQSQAEQLEYDRITRHGLDRDAQRAQRQRHAELIRDLSQQWNDLSLPAAAASPARVPAP